MTNYDPYKTPSDKVFNKLRAEAVKIWSEYGNEYGYSSDKIKRVESITNHKDNYWEIISMFDSSNQERLFRNSTGETREFLLEALTWEKQQYDNLNNK